MSGEKHASDSDSMPSAESSRDSRENGRLSFLFKTQNGVLLLFKYILYAQNIHSFVCFSGLSGWICLFYIYSLFGLLAATEVVATLPGVHT